MITSLYTLFADTSITGSASASDFINGREWGFMIACLCVVVLVVIGVFWNSKAFSQDLLELYKSTTEAMNALKESNTTLSGKFDIFIDKMSDSLDSIAQRLSSHENRIQNLENKVDKEDGNDV